jgi:hypothetical protein
VVGARKLFQAFSLKRNPSENSSNGRLNLKVRKIAAAAARRAAKPQWRGNMPAREMECGVGGGPRGRRGSRQQLHGAGGDETEARRGDPVNDFSLIPPMAAWETTGSRLPRRAPVCPFPSLSVRHKQTQQGRIARHEQSKSRQHRFCCGRTRYCKFYSGRINRASECLDSNVRADRHLPQASPRLSVARHAPSATW